MRVQIGAFRHVSQEGLQLYGLIANRFEVLRGSLFRSVCRKVGRWSRGARQRNPQYPECDKHKPDVKKKGFHDFGGGWK